ncbi:hypothetical protein F4782DRAFT_546646 [Xylaria castorea]|nr:hypothetical protein F4782DRAFT_546646 [Xylaria castorea]
MRYSVASQALCGAITVSALTVPTTQVQKRVQHVDISNFKSFPTADPKVSFDKADAAVRDFFKQGMFNDGPMDKSGRWIGRPLAVLEAVSDKLELHFEELQDKIEDNFEKVQDHVEDLQHKSKAKAGLHRRKNKSNNHAKEINRDILPFPDFSDFFGKPDSQPNPPIEPEQPTKVPGNSEGASEPEKPPGGPEKAPSGPEKTPSGPEKTPAGPEKAPGGSKETAGNSAATCDPSNPHVRFEWSSYSNADRTAFVQAIKCLQGKPSGGSQYTGSTNRYEDLISVHRGMTADIHQTAAFLVWHRYFVWVFEQLLRDECGFNRAMPWWDETKHAGAFAASDLFTNNWFGNLPGKTSDGQGTCIESGEFSGTTLHVGPGNNNDNHCLSRAVDESQTAQCNQDFTNSCLAMTTYEEFRDCFELGPHGYGHNGIGAVMAEVSASVGDPVFFMHHLFVDHTFRIWQNANPSRRTTISGCANKANPCTPITLDTMLSSNGLRPDITVRDIMDTLSGTICYRYDY